MSKNQATENQADDDNRPLCNAIAGHIPPELIGEAQANNWLTDDFTRIFRYGNPELFTGKDVLIWENSIVYIFSSVMIRDVQSIYMMVAKDADTLALRCIKDDLLAAQSANTSE